MVHKKQLSSEDALEKCVLMVPKKQLFKDAVEKMEGNILQQISSFNVEFKSMRDEF